jgi:hypothetical protein
MINYILNKNKNQQKNKNNENNKINRNNCVAADIRQNAGARQIHDG